jgi:hypothetical protein
MEAVSLWREDERIFIYREDGSFFPVGEILNHFSSF